MTPGTIPNGEKMGGRLTSLGERLSLGYLRSHCIGGSALIGTLKVLLWINEVKSASACHAGPAFHVETDHPHDLRLIITEVVRFV